MFASQLDLCLVDKKGNFSDDVHANQVLHSIRKYHISKIKIIGMNWLKRFFRDNSNQLVNCLKIKPHQKHSVNVN